MTANQTMEFPSTFDEFVEEYGLVDTEEIYTNGATLIPVNRVKQWLAHIDRLPSQGTWRLVRNEEFTKEDRCIHRYNIFECSECGRQECLTVSYDPYIAFPYCHCGARMINKE